MKITNPLITEEKIIRGTEGNSHQVMPKWKLMLTKINNRAMRPVVANTMTQYQKTRKQGMPGSKEEHHIQFNME